jgi:extradiol dioxygenase family protein
MLVPTVSVPCSRQHRRYRASSQPRAQQQPAYRVERSPAEDAAIRARTAFHLAIPTHSLEAARRFYGDVLGLPQGRSSSRWVDWNCYGHQLVCHVVDGYRGETATNAVDGDPVPVPHFGLALSVDDFHSLVQRLTSKGVRFELEPHIRFAGAPGEQWCAFLRDESGNALELKAMTTPDNLFAQYNVV